MAVRNPERKAFQASQSPGQSPGSTISIERSLGQLMKSLEVARVCPDQFLPGICSKNYDLNLRLSAEFSFGVKAGSESSIGARERYLSDHLALMTIVDQEIMSAHPRSPSDQPCQQLPAM